MMFTFNCKEHGVFRNIHQAYRECPLCAKDANAAAENAASEAERADDEWDIEDDNPNFPKDNPLVGLIVDTRDWLFPNTETMREMNALFANIQWAEMNHINSTAKKLEINRFISARNWGRFR